MAQTLIRFAYQGADEQPTKRELVDWAEEGHYLKGFDTTVRQVRTFRKDRIVEYFDDAAQFLASPLGVSPPRLRSGPPRPKDERPQILFTGFPAVQRAHLEQLSDAAGLCVVKSVTAGLLFLCAGPRAGPAKVQQARLQRVYIVREPALHALLETGELPDDSLDESL